MAQTPRFYIDSAVATGVELDLPEDVAHHAVRVLRLSDGAPMTVFNGLGGEFHGSLSLTSNGRQARFRPVQWQEREAELDYPVHVGQGLCAGEKMDWLIEKCVELGVARVTALDLQKCVARLSAERAGKRLERWRQMVVAASEQSGRNRLMALAAPLDLDQFIASSSSARYRLVLSPTASPSLGEFANSSPPGPIAILIGPEGGLSPAEIEQAVAAGFMAVHLGPRILRTETAALATLAALSALWGQTG
jgi:16S rRNA (uracil1498-N3)-methyltransferase